jgi:hypothetical protein
VVVRPLDFTSTEECLRRLWQQCHEGEPPSALVHNKVVFAAYEVGVSVVSILAQMRADPAWSPEAGVARSGDRHRVRRTHGG